MYWVSHYLISDIWFHFYHLSTRRCTWTHITDAWGESSLQQEIFSQKVLHICILPLSYSANKHLCLPITFSVCVCYLVHQRGFGFQRLTGISNQASGPHYSHGSGRVIKPLIILYLMCSCILSICGYKMVFNACLFSCTVCCTNGLSNTCVQMFLLVRLICLRLSLRD